VRPSQSSRLEQEDSLIYSGVGPAGHLQVQVRSDMPLVACFSDAACRRRHTQTGSSSRQLANDDVGDTVGIVSGECDRHTLSCSQHSLQNADHGLDDVPAKPLSDEFARASDATHASDSLRTVQSYTEIHTILCYFVPALALIVPLFTRSDLAPLHFALALASAI
jgi:hypothetical protein